MPKQRLQRRETVQEKTQIGLIPVFPVAFPAFVHSKPETSRFVSTSGGV